LPAKKLVKDDVYELLAKISGWMLLTYIIAKSVDTFYWATVTAPARGFRIHGFLLRQPGLLRHLDPDRRNRHWGLYSRLHSDYKGGRENKKLLFGAAALAIMGLLINRWVMVLQVMAVPLMPFQEEWFMYSPAWTEVITSILPIAYGIILISIAYRFLPLFPQEKELNPLK
jgi:menaquinone reductase, integral membrane subunit